MRPGSIVQFERLFLGWLAVRVVSDAIGFSATMAGLKANQQTAAYGATMVIVGLLIVYAAAIALWYFAARRASVVAKWIIAVCFIIGFCSMALALFKGGFGLNLTTVLNIVSFGLFSWATSYLFKPDADAWFAKAPSA